MRKYGSVQTQYNPMKGRRVKFIQPYSEVLNSGNHEERQCDGERSAYDFYE